MVLASLILIILLGSLALGAGYVGYALVKQVQYRRALVAKTKPYEALPPGYKTRWYTTFVHDLPVGELGYMAAEDFYVDVDTRYLYLDVFKAQVHDREHLVKRTEMHPNVVILTRSDKTTFTLNLNGLPTDYEFTQLRHPIPKSYLRIANVINDRGIVHQWPMLT